MKFYGPIFFVSNFALNSTDQALRNLLYDVYAGHAFWTYEEVVWPTHEVKEEYQYDGAELPTYPLWELLEGETDSDE